MINSVKFTNEGCITLRIVNEDRMIKVITSDTGIGMNEKTQQDLFIPFKKTIENNPQGAGLGMYIVEDLTNRSGTEIQFSSKLNKGSYFWFKMPQYTMNGNQINNEKEYGKELEAVKLNSINSDNRSAYYVHRGISSPHNLAIQETIVLISKEETNPRSHH